MCADFGRIMHTCSANGAGQNLGDLIMNGYETITKNMFIGKKPHELSIVMTNGKLGDIRRFAVQNIGEAKTKCAELNVTLKN